MRKPIITSTRGILLLLLSGLCPADEPTRNNAYLDLTPPDGQAVLFAPGIVSDGLNNRDLAITPDGAEFYYAVNLRKFGISTILTIHKTNDGWSEPEVADFARDSHFNFLEPAISPDGLKFFFVKAAKDGKNNNDIWVMDRAGSGWGQARKLGANINTDVSETFPSITADGSLYFSRVSDDPSVEHIYRSRLQGDQYLPAERLPENVNSGKTQFNAFVAPDESYLIVSVYGREDSLGSIDYYIVYRNEHDQWSAPVNMGERVNTASAQEYSAYVSRDGKYLFFMSSRLPSNTADKAEYSIRALREIHNAPENGNSDIYWMSAGIIEELRPEDF